MERLKSCIMEEARALPLPTAEPAVERFLFGGRRVAPRLVATATAVVAAGASSVASVFSGGESFTASPPSIPAKIYISNKCSTAASNLRGNTCTTSNKLLI